jgi:hypothetical protein
MTSHAYSSTVQNLEYIALNDVSLLMLFIRNALPSCAGCSLRRVPSDRPSHRTCIANIRLPTPCVRQLLGIGNSPRANNSTVRNFAVPYPPQLYVLKPWRGSVGGVTSYLLRLTHCPESFRRNRYIIGRIGGSGVMYSE